MRKFGLNQINIEECLKKTNFSLAGLKKIYDFNLMTLAGHVSALLLREMHAANEAHNF